MNSKMNSMEFYTKLCSLKSMLHLMVCTLLYWISHRNDMKLYHINIFCGLFLPWHNKNFLLFHKHLQNSEERKKMLAFRWIDTMFERCNNILDLARIWKEVTFDLGLKLVTLHWLFGFRSSIIHKMWFFYLYNVVHLFFCLVRIYVFCCAWKSCDCADSHLFVNAFYTISQFWFANIVYRIQMVMRLSFKEFVIKQQRP